MSKAAAPAPKQNFLQTMLLMFVVMMAYQLFIASRQQPQGPAVSTDQLLKQMRDLNAQRLDVRIVGLNNDYANALEDQVKQKKLTQAEADQKKVEGVILVADTQMMAGIHSGDSGRLRDAYITLQPLEKQYLDKPIWNTPVKVADIRSQKGWTKSFGAGWDQWTGQGLYTEVVNRLTEANRTELVYGVIPGYQFMDALVHATGAVPWYSYAFASFLLALLVRATVYKLQQKQLMWGRQMSQLGPLAKEIKDEFADDAAEAQRRTMKLYQEYGINPLQGCLPALVQAPLFITVYQCMIRYQFAFQKGTFLWINKPLSLATHGFIAPNLGQTDYILIVIYGITMLSSTLLMPVSDPSQAKQQKIMSVGMSLLFTFFMFTGKFPVVSGFVLYWVFTNLLSTIQSLRAYRMPMPPLVKVNAAGGGVYPQNPPSRFARWMEQAQKMQEDAKGGGDAKNGGSVSSKWLTADPPAKPSTNGSAKPKPASRPNKKALPAKSNGAPESKPKKAVANPQDTPATDESAKAKPKKRK